MTQARPYFFCGIGGSGMLPLALILRARGEIVEGSDRALDQGRSAAKFDFLRARGIGVRPQDGSGVTSAAQILVKSAAVEDCVPDVQAALRLGARQMLRAELLAELFNASKNAIAIGGTSGKSTTTGMIGWILTATGRDPTIMNGAVMKNFAAPDAPFASARVGQETEKGDIFVSEVDESDGSIARFNPRVAVLNNISLDHKSMEELRGLFGDFIAKAEIAILNLDNAETAALAHRAKAKITYSLTDAGADLRAENLTPAPDGISFDAITNAERARVRIAMPGAHNVANALASLAAAQACEIPLREAAQALGAFTGIRRRLEFVGTANAITVIDDFGHNPDKIAATLQTLHAFPGRLLILFQPHGYGPLRLMRREFVECFATQLAEADALIMPNPAYFGGTVERTVTSADIAADIRAKGRAAFAYEDRPACREKLLDMARPGDRIIVMGARDDTLSEFAAELVSALAPVKASA